jgi:hypothetical protein
LKWQGPSRPRLRATYHRTGGVRHLVGALGLAAALREFAGNGTGHATCREQNSKIRRYIAWRIRHASDSRLHLIIGGRT